MGKEEERTRVKTKEKSPHLEPRASRDRDSSQHVGTSHQRQREEAVTLTGDTTSKDCDHFCYDTEEMGVVLATIESLKQAPACEDCLKETAERRAAGNTIMCMECRRCFGTGPHRHARGHARNADHPVGLLFDQPDCAYCYKCRHSLCLRAIIEAVRAKGRASVPADGRGCVFRGTPCLGNACCHQY